MSEPSATPNPQAPDPSKIARLFPGYQVQGIVGTGRSGAVYKARQVSLDRDVAIKVLPKEFTTDSGFHSRFTASVMAMARLNHPNLISIYDFGEAEGVLFVIMEFVPGKSLFHSAHGMAISSKETARIVTGICEGLAHAHEHGIIHRDLNPGNILLTPKVKPKIGDFDITRRHEGARPESYPYASPELFSDPERADARADVFAVGVMLHELLAGSLPIADPRPPSAIVGCDPRFDIIVRRAVHPSPDMRYPDAAAMGRDLREVLDSLTGPVLRTAAPAGGVGPGAGRPIPPPRTTSTIPSSSSASAVPWVVAAIVAAAAGLLFLMFSGGSGSSSAPPRSTRTTSNDFRTSRSASSKPKHPKRRKHKPRIQRSTERYVPPPPLELDDPKPPPEPETAEESPESGAEPDAAGESPEPAPDAVAENPENEPEAEPAPKPESTFDTTGWLEMARSKMREKARPALAEYEKKISRNFEDFRRGVKRVLRQIDNRDRRKIEPKAESLIEACRENSSRVPEKFDFGLGKVNPRGQREEKDLNAKLLGASKKLMADTLRKALEKQTETDRDFSAEMLELTQTYILGIELQIKRLEEANDTAAADILQAEVDATRERPERFTRLMQGLDPDPPPPPEEEKKKK